MLATLSWCQFLDVSNRISILVTSLGCWCPTLILKDRVCWWQKQTKPSPTSQSYRQRISSPTSVTIVDVACRGRQICQGSLIYPDYNLLTVLWSWRTSGWFGWCSWKFSRWSNWFCRTTWFPSSIHSRKLTFVHVLFSLLNLNLCLWA